MRIFELHFNKEPKEDLVFDSFCFQPENFSEKKRGSLFVVGELRNALPKNLKFLDKLANFLKKNYYSVHARFSPEACLKETLKKANGFLDEITKAGDVSWLGNLNLAVFNLLPVKDKWWEINFTKTGTIKILLLRSGEIIDMGKNLELQDFEPYPLKIFGNIVSGKLTEGDVILAATQDVFSVLASSLQRGNRKKSPAPLLSNMIKRISGLDFSEGNGEKKLKEILRTKEKELMKTSGICLLCILTKESGGQRPRIFALQKETANFSILKIFQPAGKALKNLKTRLLKGLKTIKETPQSIFRGKGLKKEKKERKKKVKTSAEKLKIDIFKSLGGKSGNFRKNLILISLLVFFLLLGFFLFKREQANQLKSQELTLTTAQSELARADNFLTLQNEDKAFAILKENYQKVLPLAEKKGSWQATALSLKNSFEERMIKISRLENLSAPETFFEFNQKEFVPQRMLYFKGSLYFYNPFNNNVFKLTQNKQKSLINANQKFSDAVAFGDSLLFFEKPNSLFPLKNDQFGEMITLKSPFADFNPKDIAAYQANLYLLDGEKGEIIKYPTPLAQGKNSPQIWLKSGTKKATTAKAMAVSSNIWVLLADNTIAHYFQGNYQNSFTLNLFPFAKELSKISAQSDYLFLMEPVQKRLIILTRDGKIIRQLQSEKFNDLKDFTVSPDLKTIWILNGQKVYRILNPIF